MAMRIDGGKKKATKMVKRKQMPKPQREAAAKKAIEKKSTIKSVSKEMAGDLKKKMLEPKVRVRERKMERGKAPAPKRQEMKGKKPTSELTEQRPEIQKLGDEKRSIKDKAKPKARGGKATMRTMTKKGAVKRTLKKSI